MKDFKHWGLKVRALPKYNYRALWYNLKTVRLGEDNQPIKELPPYAAEFYDVALGTKCNAECPFCYVSASHNGVNYKNICEVWNNWIESFPEKKVGKVTYTLKPFQIAIGEQN